MNDDFTSIVALDIGSSLVKVVAGRVIKDNIIEIIGASTTPCNGIKNGAIINIETTIKSIREAVSHAELMAGIQIEDVIVNISGKTIRSGNHKNVVAITNRERIVMEEDVQRVIDAILATTPIPSDQQIVHVLSKEFSVDDQTSIKEPLGMTGVRLEGEAHIVTSGITTIHNLDKCVSNAGLNQIDKVLSSFASAEAVLTSEEKELGTAVIDIGAGITDIVIYVEGGICHTSVVPFGGINITNDISIGLKTPVEAAETIKKKYGHTLKNAIDPTEKIEVPAISGRPSKIVLRQDLIRIIEPRLREILEHVNYELEVSGKKSMLAGGVILTGGTSLLHGIETLAEEIIGLSVARAKPAGLSGLSEAVSSPEFSTSVGLIKYLARSEFYVEEQEPTRWPVGNASSSAGSSSGKNTFKKIWKWVENNL
ncbi:MAG: cell division protein FtsA [Leptospiraceae bacterium]|nr:cell division protein FtsA [Leptospiraceae bacterium]